MEGSEAATLVRHSPSSCLTVRAAAEEEEARLARQARCSGSAARGPVGSASRAPSAQSTAAHSLAGVSEEGLALPDILGRFLGAKLPGTQKSALASVQIIREQRPGVEERLAACQPLVDGLSAAKGSSDATVASGAAEILAALSK